MTRGKRRSAAVLAAVLALLMACGDGTVPVDYYHTDVILPSGTTAESAAAVREALDACALMQGLVRRDCYGDRIRQHLAQAGVDGALAMLRGIVASDLEARPDGHVHAHAIGIEAYHATGDPAVFARCTSDFASGCHHGVLQAHLAASRVASLDWDTTAARLLCASHRDAPARGSRWLLFQCLHGMGHGLDIHFAYNLPRVLEVCDLLPDVWERESCYGGAFMENLMHVTEPHHAATRLGGGNTDVHDGHGFRPASSIMPAPPPFVPLDPADPLYPCSVVRRRYQPACYLLQTSAMLHANGGDIAAAGRECERAPADMRRFCFQSLGRDITGHARQSPGETARLCALSATRYREWCYFGAAKSLVDWSSLPADGFALCALIPERDNARRCYEAVGEQVATLSAFVAEREALCRGSGDQQSEDACRFGARLGKSTAHLR